MAVGIILGYFVPSTQVVLNRTKFVDVSLPLGRSLSKLPCRARPQSLDTAIALIVMMWPILCRVSPAALVKLFSGRQVWYHLAFSFVVNWIFAPLLMLGLAWAFLPDKEGLREGLILVGIARCIAMVRVANCLLFQELTGADAGSRLDGYRGRRFGLCVLCHNIYAGLTRQADCAVLVAFNSILQIVLYAPFALLYIRVIGHTANTGPFDVSYSVVAKSVAVFLGIPFGAAILTRGFFIAIRKQDFFHRHFLPAIAPLSLIALLFTTLIIFAAQGRQVSSACFGHPHMLLSDPLCQVVTSITSVLRVAAPLIVYFTIMFLVVLLVCKRFGVGYRRTTSQAFTGASNNFEVRRSGCCASKVFTLLAACHRSSCRFVWRREPTSTCSDRRSADRVSACVHCRLTSLTACFAQSSGLARFRLRPCLVQEANRLGRRGQFCRWRN